MIDPSTQDKYSKRVGSLCSDCSVLTASILSDINQVFYANGIEQILSATDLSIRYVTADDYHELVAGASSEGSKFEPKTLYVVSSDELNAYNSQIKNVGDPIDGTDAANKSWVDIQILAAQMSANDYTDQLLPVLSNKLDRRSTGCTIASASTIAYGSNAVASGNQSIAIGSSVSAIAGKSISIGNNCKANASYAIALMNGSAATAANALAIGTSLTAAHDKSYVYGDLASSTEKRQFIWSATTYSYQPVEMSGTFNIDPENGISGFYIGLSSLDDILNERCIDGMLSDVQLYGTQLVFSFNNDASTAPISVDLSSFDKKTDEVSAFAMQVSSLLSEKQDKLEQTQMQAINAAVNERATTIMFNDGTMSSYNWSGTINRTTMQNEGLYDSSSSSWISVIQSVKVGNAVTSIGDSAFSRCYSLTSLQVPNTVVKLESWSLNVCSSLQDIVLPSSLSTIYSNALSGCTSLTSITFKDRTLDNIPSGYDNKWGAANAEIYTWNAASREWIENEISSMPRISSISADYEQGHIKLSADGQVVGDIDCAGFLSDIYVSQASLSGTQLVLDFNNNASSISVELSSVPDSWAQTDEHIVKKDSNGNIDISLSNGLSGFSINNDNFIQCVLSAVQLMSDDQLSALKEKLGLNS